ncbi:hypothetical protein A3Q56_04939 [Intoshia linei]|uniref:DH domain-containing protein n=1 Tax=Intoshia linei TaxID=1819745 RepID=A0A177B1L7_9BILA|nr:hypothetical protein A3Q56_04939 [Intoshia linei]
MEKNNRANTTVTDETPSNHITNKINNSICNNTCIMSDEDINIKKNKYIEIHVATPAKTIFESNDLQKNQFDEIFYEKLKIDLKYFKKELDDYLNFKQKNTRDTYINYMFKYEAMLSDSRSNLMKEFKQFNSDIISKMTYLKSKFESFKRESNEKNTIVSILKRMVNKYDTEIESTTLKETPIDIIPDDADESKVFKEEKPFIDFSIKSESNVENSTNENKKIKTGRNDLFPILKFLVKIVLENKDYQTNINIDKSNLNIKLEMSKISKKGGNSNSTQIKTNDNPTTSLNSSHINPEKNYSKHTLQKDNTIGPLTKKINEESEIKNKTTSVTSTNISGSRGRESIIFGSLKKKVNRLFYNYGVHVRSSSIHQKETTESIFPKKRIYILNELISTELSYVKVKEDLEYVVTDLLVPSLCLNQNESLEINVKKSKKPLNFQPPLSTNYKLSPTDSRLIFAKIDSLYTLHCELHKEMNFEVETNNERSTITPIILKFLPEMLKIYPFYVFYIDVAQERFSVLEKTEPDFNNYMQNVKRHPDFKKLSILTLMHRPIVRLPQMKLLLIGINFSIYILYCIRSIEDNQKKGENFKKIFKIGQLMEDCPPQLVSSNRDYVDQFDFVDIYSDSIDTNGKRGTLFIFSDLILITKRKGKEKGVHKSDSIMTTNANNSSNDSKIHKCIESIELDDIITIVDVINTKDTIIVIMYRKWNVRQENVVAFYLDSIHPNDIDAKKLKARIMLTMYKSIQNRRSLTNTVCTMIKLNAQKLATQLPKNTGMMDSMMRFFNFDANRKTLLVHKINQNVKKRFTIKYRTNSSSRPESYWLDGKEIEREKFENSKMDLISRYTAIKLATQAKSKSEASSDQEISLHNDKKEKLENIMNENDKLFSFKKTRTVLDKIETKSLNFE